MRGLDGNIVDPDQSMMYTKRKLHQLSMSNTVTATGVSGTSTTTTADSSSQTQHIPKFPSEGWSTLLSKTSWLVDGPTVFSSLSKAESWTLDLDFLGDFRFLAEADFHSKIDGTALSWSVRIPDRDTLKSASLKCLEHTRVFSFILKCRPMSLRIARIHSSQIFSPSEI